MPRIVLHRKRIIQKIRMKAVSKMYSGKESEFNFDSRKVPPPDQREEDMVRK